MISPDLNPLGADRAFATSSVRYRVFASERLCPVITSCRRRSRGNLAGGAGSASAPYPMPESPGLSDNVNVMPGFNIEVVCERTRAGVREFSPPLRGPAELARP